MLTRVRRLLVPLVLAGSLGLFGTAVASIHATADRLEVAATPAPVLPTTDDAPGVSPRPWECDEPTTAPRTATPDGEPTPSRRTRAS